MLKRIRKTIGNAYATFTSIYVNLWVSKDTPPPWGNWFWAQTPEEAIDILTCYFVAKCRLVSASESLEVVDFLEKNEMFWPLIKPEIDAKMDDILASWVNLSISFGPY